MSKWMKKTSKKIGLPPGSLVHVGEKKSETVKMTVFSYNEEAYLEKEVDHIEDSFKLRDKSKVTWINIDGLHNMEIIEKIGNYFGVHALVLEDILHTEQRSKIEDFNDHLFMVLKMIYPDRDRNGIQIEQISFLLGSDYVVSFQEREGDVFNAIRERIRNNKGRIRKMGADYLAYALIDMIVDHYFIILERCSEDIERIEDQLNTSPTQENLKEIHRLKRNIILLRKSVWPLREVIGGLGRGEFKLIHQSTLVYLRDIYDHTIQVIDTIESFRDMVSGMIDTYLSILSNRMNEVMKVLTIIATIFIPLTFIAGIYGMNFEFMPELKLRWAYPVVWLLMIMVAVCMLINFRKKKWL